MTSVFLERPKKSCSIYFSTGFSKTFSGNVLMVNKPCLGDTGMYRLKPFPGSILFKISLTVNHRTPTFNDENIKKRLKFVVIYDNTIHTQS